MRPAWGVTLSGAAVLAWGEWLHWRWSRMLVGGGRAGSVAVVVPGYRNPRPAVNFVNRSRVRIACRSVAADSACDIRMIFSGGATGGAPAEARLMASYATTAFNFDGRVLIEDQSMTTWENITNVIPHLDDVDRVKIATQPAHALKARAYVRRQRPDLAEKLVSAGEYRLGEWMALKPLLALYGLWTLRGLGPDERTISR